MGKRTRKRRVMPRTGRMLHGSYRTEYVDGVRDGEAAASGNTERLPLSVKTSSHRMVVNRTFPADPQPTSVVEVVKQIGKEQIGTTIKVAVRDKVWWCKGRRYGELLGGHQSIQSQGEYLARSREYWQGVKAAEREAYQKDKTSRDIQQRRLLMAAVEDECQRRGVDHRLWLRNGGTWEDLAKMLADDHELAIDDFVRRRHSLG